MAIDPLETVKSTEPDDNDEPSFAQYRKLNSFIAITIALLATFMGICKVKDDNIVQAMQQAQEGGQQRYGDGDKAVEFAELRK